MKIHARRRVGLVAAVAFIGLGAGFTCDHPTETELATDGSMLAAVSGHAINGQVSARGASLPGVAVKLAKTGAAYTAMTNTEGAFAFGAVNAGTYNLSAKAVGVKGLPSTVTLTSLGTVEVNSDAVVTVDAPTHELALSVTLGGAPLADGRVHCTMGVDAVLPDGREVDGSQLMAGYTGEDGVFRSPLLPKAGTSTCFLYPLKNNQNWTERFLVRDVNADIELSMELPGVGYQGALQVNGKAAPGQTLKLGGSMEAKAGTNDSGGFDFGLVPGWYSLVISGGDADGLLPAEYSLVAGSSTGTPRRNISSEVAEDLDLPVKTLTVEVTGIGGAPVEGAVVDQVVEGTAFKLAGWNVVDGQYRVRGTSDAKGVIRLPLFPRAEGLEIAVKAPEGSILLDASVALEDVSADASVSVSLAPANQPPVASAGGPYVVDEGSPVKLDGSASSDADGDKLTYAWRLPDGSVVDGASVGATFADGPAEHVAVLTVTDPSGQSSSAEARITVRNVAPSVFPAPRIGIMSAGPQTVVSGESFELAAAFDDPGEDAWSWHVDWDTGVMSEGGASAPGEIVVQSPIYRAPGEYVVRVVVQDDDGDSGEAEIVLNVVRRAVGLDILPGSSDNPFSLKSRGNGVLAVAVLSDGDFDATSLDVGSLTLGNGVQPGASVSVRGGRHHASVEDVNGDALPDLLVHFDRAAVGEYVTAETTQLVLWGETSEEVAVEGVDAIRPK